MERINLTHIRSQTTSSNRLRAAMSELERVKEVVLTDLLIERDSASGVLLSLLDNEEKNGKVDDEGFRQPGVVRTWKIQLLKDQWGNPYKPGDEYIIKTFIGTRQQDGKKRTNAEIKAMKQRGEENKLYSRRKYIVDDRLCIECGYRDAVTLIVNYGVHFETGYAMNGRPREIGALCKHPDGSMKHVHNWRLKEAPSWVYNKLPKVNKKKTKNKEIKPDVELPKVENTIILDGQVIHETVMNANDKSKQQGQRSLVEETGPQE